MVRGLGTAWAPSIVTQSRALSLNNPTASGYHLAGRTSLTRLATKSLMRHAACVRGHARAPARRMTGTRAAPRRTAYLGSHRHVVNPCGHLGDALCLRASERHNAHHGVLADVKGGRGTIVRRGGALLGAISLANDVPPIADTHPRRHV